MLDELARHRVQVAFADAPAIDDDPQAKLLTQVQGVIAEYERAKIAERYRRGKLFRSRAGEVIAWRVPYGYRRLPRDSAGPARLEIYEPEADVVRRIFHDTVAGGCSTREISRRLAADQISTPSGRRAIWRTSTISRLLRNEAYIGRVYFNRTETVPAPGIEEGSPTSPPTGRGMGDHPGPADHRRTDVHRREQDHDGQHQMEPPPRRARPMATERPCQVRCLRSRHQRPPDARPER